MKKIIGIKSIDAEETEFEDLDGTEYQRIDLEMGDGTTKPYFVSLDALIFGSRTSCGDLTIPREVYTLGRNLKAYRNTKKSLLVSIACQIHKHEDGRFDSDFEEEN